MIKNNKTVFVGVSGGVDSSVSLAILKDQGYNVVGVFIRTWTPDFIECTWKEERRDAMRVCAHLDVPFLECDAEEAYKKGVAEYMIEEYKKGKTPNPDVMCNREVKFGIFWNFAKERGADFIATGHYAQNNYELKINKYELLKSQDKSKDQVYFLWTLTQEDLSHTLFPVGHLEKKEVRKLANKYKLPTAVKKDSQGVCFLGQLDMKNFLKHYIKEKRGNVLNENDEIIGYHDGAHFFTLGERHGFVITNKTENDKPYYVVSKDIKSNTITVSNILHNFNLLINRKDKNTIKIINTNWICLEPQKNKKYLSQIRYHGEYIECEILLIDKDKTEVKFEKNVLIDKGQSIVFYDNDICLGGGIVDY